MTDSQNDIAGLAARLSALEKANRRWRMGSLLLFVLLVAAVSLMGTRSFAGLDVEKPAPKAVVAREFVLQDAQGNVRGRMTMMAGNPVLQFYDRDGQLWWFAPPKMGVLPIAKPH